MNHKALLVTTYVFVILGALNWGVIGVMDLNLVNVFLGGSPTVEKVVYILMGGSAVYDILVARGGYRKAVGGGRKKKKR